MGRSRGGSRGFLLGELRNDGLSTRHVAWGLEREHQCPGEGWGRVRVGVCSRCHWCAPGQVLLRHRIDRRSIKCIHGHGHELGGWGNRSKVAKGLSYLQWVLLTFFFFFFLSSGLLVFRSWWRTGKPGVLQSMGLQRVRHDWATELNWTGFKLQTCHFRVRISALSSIFLPLRSYS